MSYRPITDVWILARPKVKYYGAYPAGFLHRARHLLGVGPNDAVLHVCAGKVREYPYRGLGPRDKTLDMDPATSPDFVQDAREPLPRYLCGDATCLECEDGLWLTPEIKGHEWAGVLIDRPYTEDDADQYVPGRATLPPLNDLVRRALAVVPVGHRVGVLDYQWPHPGSRGQEVAVVGVGTGRNARARWFTVFERTSEETA